jgi:hypothetical protein
MRIGVRAIFRSTLALALAAGMLVPNATAGQVTVTFQGTVTGAGTGVHLPTNVQVGQTISGYFTYNPLQTGSSGNYNFAGTGQSEIFSIPILNNTATFSGQNSNVAPNNVYAVKITDTGVKGATFDVSVDMINTAGKTTGTTCDILFTSSTYTGVALPQTQAAFTAAFASSTAKFNWDPDGDGIGADINIINGQAVPEPSSMVLALVAMAGFAGFFICRRVPKVLKRDQIAQPSHA